jgi:hypothetical protein
MANTGGPNNSNGTVSTIFSAGTGGGIPAIAGTPYTPTDSSALSSAGSGTALYFNTLFAGLSGTGSGTVNDMAETLKVFGMWPR